jgi:hypothetical protein
VIHEPTLSDDRLRQRRDHLMSEIDLLQASEPAASQGEATRGSARGWSPGGRWSRYGLRYGLPGGVLIAGAVVGLVLAMSPATAPGGPATSTALRIERVSQATVAVRIVDNRASAEAMTRQLHAQGLNVTVDTLAASPQLVGVWVGAGYSAQVPRPVAETIDSQLSGYTATVELPASFSGEITLSAGRAPGAGEQPTVIGQVNALSPGGRLGCLQASQGQPQQVRRQVEAYGYTVTWADGDDPDTAALSAPRPGQRVVTGYIDDAVPAVVRLVTAVPGSTRYEARSRLGYSPGQWAGRARNAATCTHA